MYFIEDFPPEIIELFTPDLKPETLSILKLVSKRFYSVFSADRFFENFMHRPEKEHRSLMLGECKGHGVKEVAEKIVSGELGRWRGCVELEKTHYRNWRNARLDSFDELPIALDDFLSLKQTFVEDLVDEEFEHWIMCTACSVYYNSTNFFLFNVTGKPALTFAKSFPGKRFAARLLPGQVTLFDEDRGLFEVYDVVRGAERFLLEFRWSVGCAAETAEPRGAFEDGRFNPVPTPTTSGWVAAIVSGGDRNVLVASQNGESAPERDRVHVWNLKTGEKMGRVDFKDREPWREIWARDWHQREVKIYRSQFPYVIVKINDCCRSSPITLFNVLTSDVTLVDQNLPGLDDRWCLMVGKYVMYILVTGRSLNGIERATELSLYRVDPSGERCKLLLRAERDTPTFVAVFNYRILVTFNQSEYWLTYVLGNESSSAWELLYSPLQVNVYSLAGDSAALERSFSLPNLRCPNDFITFVDPDLLVFFNQFRKWTVYNLKGEELCSREGIDLNMPYPTSWRRFPAFGGQSTSGSHLFLSDDKKSARL